MINIGRRLRRGTQALALAAALAGGTVALTSAQPALAATTGATDSLYQPYCGWRLVQAYADPEKVTHVWLPTVTGANQTVRLVVEFMHYNNGWQPYRSGWFHTFQVSGQPTYWKSDTDGRSYNTIEDSPPESGYASPAASSPLVAVRVTAYWYSGNTYVGTVSLWAQNSNNPFNSSICNGGLNYASS
jgi:hypothetical protein